MTTAGRVASGALVLIAVTLVACGKGDQGSGYATDGNTGAASPASTPDYSATKNLGASTGAVAAPAGGAAAAGDTTTARQKRAGSSTAATPSPAPARPE